jgi:hypothetical protein
MIQDRTNLLLTFFTTLGSVPRWKPSRVFHSVPSGRSMLRSNCALLVYGNGKSFIKYLAAFLSLFSEIMTCAFWWSARDFGSIPAIFLMRWGFEGCRRVPNPPHVPYTNECFVLMSGECQTHPTWKGGVHLTRSVLSDLASLRFLEVLARENQTEQNRKGIE